MPTSTKEKIIFLAMMGFAMTLGMESYNLILLRLPLTDLLKPLCIDLPVMLGIVIITQHFFAGPLARKISFRFVHPGVDHPFKVMFCISTCTVLLMCPLMSFFATLLFKRGMGNMGSVWLTTFLFNLPMAYCWQMLIAGPSVRKLFRLIYRPAMA